MLKVNKKTEYIISAIYITISVGIWVHLFFEWKLYHQYLTYSALVLGALYSLFFVKDRWRALMITGALIFGLIADYFLVLKFSHTTLAMCFFLGAQLCYALLTSTFARSKKGLIIQLAIRLIITALGIGLVYIVLSEGAEPLYVISVAYYVNMLYSAIISYIHFRDGTMQKFVAIGLTVFALCDIAVGFDFLISIFGLGPGNIIYELKNLPFNLSVLFYIPSQITLCLATKTKTKKAC